MHLTRTDSDLILKNWRNGTRAELHTTALSLSLSSCLFLFYHPSLSNLLPVYTLSLLLPNSLSVALFRLSAARYGGID